MDSFITVVAAGAAVVTGGASARVAIPVTQSGEIPRYIRVAGLNACYCRIGTSTVVATNTDALIQPADALIMHVPSGMTHIAGIQDTTAGRLNIVPLENM